MAATRALGTTLTKGVTLIGGLTEINGVDMSADTIDVTTLDSSGGYREFLAAFKDAGEVGISGFFVPGDTGQAALSTVFASGASDTYIITFPTSMGATWTFTGIVTKFTTGASVDDPVTFEATIKVSSVPVLGTTASTGASALVVTQVGGAALTAAAWTPTPFAIGTYYYTFTFTTQTAYAVKVTAASHTINLYIDGAFVETLTTAVESASIAGPVGAKEIKAVVYEAGKTPLTYAIMVGRVS